MIRKPRPELTAIISAATTTSQAMPRASRKPTRRRGRIAGRSTRRAIWRGARPKLRPAFQWIDETLPTALIAETASGRTEAMKMMKTEERSPTPNQRIASGIHARAEIGRTISTIGAKALLGELTDRAENGEGARQKGGKAEANREVPEQKQRRQAREGQEPARQ